MKDHSPVEAPRRSFTKKEHLAQYIAQDGKCNCGECNGLKLLPGEIHEQHDPPYNIMKNSPGYDGKPKWLWTKECHENYTRTVDLPTIVKTRHMGGGKGSQYHRRKKRGPSLKSNSKIKSRGFEGHRKFNGEIVRKK